MSIRQQANKVKQNSGPATQKQHPSGQASMAQQKLNQPGQLKEILNSPQFTRPENVLQLQRLYGNRAVSRMFASRNTVIQRVISHNDVEITELPKVLELLTRKAREHGRKIDFNEYTDEISTIMEKPKVFNLLDGKDLLAKYALSYIIKEINIDRGVTPGHYFKDRSLDEIIMLAGDEVEILKTGKDTYSYRNGGTNKLEDTLKEKEYREMREEDGYPIGMVGNRVLKSKDDATGLRYLKLEGTPVILRERSNAAISLDVAKKIDEELQKKARFIVDKTDILSSSAWKAARTEGEFIGTVGEYMAQIEIKKVMPEPGLVASENKFHQLANIHFLGDIFNAETGGETIHADTDAGPELDLLNVLKTPEAWQYSAVGNVKVGKTNLAGEARSQNESALLLLRSFGEQRRVLIDEGKGHWALVKSIIGTDIQSKEQISLGRPLIPAKQVTQHTIGAKDARGEYSESLEHNYNDIRDITTYIGFLGA